MPSKGNTTSSGEWENREFPAWSEVRSRYRIMMRGTKKKKKKEIWIGYDKEVRKWIQEPVKSAAVARGRESHLELQVDLGHAGKGQFPQVSLSFITASVHMTSCKANSLSAQSHFSLGISLSKHPRQGQDSMFVLTASGFQTRGSPEWQHFEKLHSNSCDEKRLLLSVPLGSECNRVLEI